MSKLIKSLSFNSIGQLIANLGGGASKVVGNGSVRITNEATISAVTSGWTADTTAIATLEKGRYLVMPYATLSGAASATMAEWNVFGNSSNDNSGNLDQGLVNASNTSGVTVGGWYMGGKPFVLEVTGTSQVLYGKAISYGANRTVKVRAHIMKIGEYV